MSKLLKPLVPVVMVGTDRKPLLPTWPGEVGALIARMTAESPDPAVAVLRTAGILITCRLAGAQGKAGTATPVPLAPDETKPEADEALAALIARAFDEGPVRLHHQVLDGLAATGHRLPAALLPMALDLGRRSVALRVSLLAALGERGRWLAGLNDDWRFAAATQSLPDEVTDEEALWLEGTVEQRLAFLARERARSPQDANDRLRRALPEMPAKERAEMVPVLAIGLSTDDVPLLDALRTDRSNEVRSAALALLLRLPDAAFTQRAIGRLAALLQKDGGRWVIEAPATPGPDWAADNLDSPRPARESLGERGWMLYQVVRQVPLSWWTVRLSMTAGELCRWASAGNWQEALMRGWRDVLKAAPDEGWCEAFLSHWAAAGLRDDPATIEALLPRPRREQYWLEALGDTTLPLVALVRRILVALPPGESLSLPFSTDMLNALRQRFTTDAPLADPALRDLLADLACALHIEAIERLAGSSRNADAPAANPPTDPTTNPTTDSTTAPTTDSAAAPGADSPVDLADLCPALGLVIATRRALRDLSPSRTI